MRKWWNTTGGASRTMLVVAVIVIALVVVYFAAGGLYFRRTEVIKRRVVSADAPNGCNLQAAVVGRWQKWGVPWVFAGETLGRPFSCRLSVEVNESVPVHAVRIERITLGVGDSAVTDILGAEAQIEYVAGNVEEGFTSGRTQAIPMQCIQGYWSAQTHIAREDIDNIVLLGQEVDIVVEGVIVYKDGSESPLRTVESCKREGVSTSVTCYIVELFEKGLE